MKIFNDYIDSKIFFKELRKFTKEEKGLVDNIYNLILRKDEKSEIIDSDQKELFNNNDFITDVISKNFIFNKQSMYLNFFKHYCYEKEYYRGLLLDVRNTEGEDIFPDPSNRYLSKKEQKYKHLIYITCQGNMDIMNDSNQPLFRPILFNVVFSKDIDWTERKNNMMGINIDYDENNFLTTLSKKNFEKFGQKISECIVEAIEPKNMSIYFR